MRRRLDQELVARGQARTRAQARDLVLRGEVAVDGIPAGKPGQLVGAEAKIVVHSGSVHYVSRGALKLVEGLEAFSFDPAGCIALDIGASTGGFTQVLLERGAAKVYAVDVGRGQLAAEVAADPRVVALEATDARALDAGVVPELASALVADVSFISLTKALGPALAIAAPEAWLVALVKPQFEAGRDAVGKGGIVRDPAERQAAIDHVAEWIGARPDWRVVGVVESPIPGGDGNQEYLLGAVRHG